jgi:hypothetical protein
MLDHFPDGVERAVVVLVVGGIAVGGGGRALDLHLQSRLDPIEASAHQCTRQPQFWRGRQVRAHRSRGYTSVFAMTAPAAPATALPHGGSTSTFDCPAIAKVLASCASERWSRSGDDRGCSR